MRKPVAVDDHWRRWIAENLLLGSSPINLVEPLLAAGVPPETARAEIEDALRSPYLQGAQRLRNRLAKRNWVIDIAVRLNRLAPLQLTRHHRPSGEQFFDLYYRTNRPVLITGMLDDCPALTHWNLDHLQQRFGSRGVEVQFGRDSDQHYEMNSIAHKRQMPFGTYIDLVRNSGPGNDFYMTANNDSTNRAALTELWQDFPVLPAYLNPVPGGAGFLWFGPAGTVTPLHHDLTNNFMAQIIGRKRVRLIAPCEVNQLYNHRHCFSPVDGRAPDLQRFPAMDGVQLLDCELAPGEILFLPVGWWHWVEALDVSVTVSATHFRWPNDFYSNYPPEHDF
jgi:hypothetical protein